MNVPPIVPFSALCQSHRVTTPPNTAPLYLCALLDTVPMCPWASSPIPATHTLEVMTLGVCLTPSLWDLFSYGGSTCPSLVTQLELSREISAEHSGPMSNANISYGMFFFTINIFHEITSEACELTLGEQGGACMVKVDSS